MGTLTHWITVPRPENLEGESFKKGIVIGNGRNAEVIQRACEYARAQCHTLIVGPTGTGKEVVASLIHREGPRKEKPFIPVSCTTLNQDLTNSQLFGHKRGAFTGANRDTPGHFGSADGGILFLDEIDELSSNQQGSLLRAIEYQEIQPVGESRARKVDVQVIATMNKDLPSAIVQGRFRQDLYQRFIGMIKLPALRYRREDIPAFIEWFSFHFAKKYQDLLWQPSQEALEDFCHFDWPGNIRQLSHVIEEAYILREEPKIPREKNERLNGDATTIPTMNLQILPFIALRRALIHSRGHKGKAAKILGVHANTLTRMLKDVGQIPELRESRDPAPLLMMMEEELLQKSLLHAQEATAQGGGDGRNAHGSCPSRRVPSRNGKSERETGGKKSPRIRLFQ
jgi:DNA-binding NtrC family response regulator